jgi:hypothetical protein
MSLVLTRRTDESIELDLQELAEMVARVAASRARCGEPDADILEDIRLIPIGITVTRIAARKVRLAIDAPDTVRITRSEINQEALK